MAEASDRRGERERREQEADQGDEALTETERDQVQEHRRLSSLTVYAIIRREGEEELQRPVSSLWWSGVAAGVGISTSVLAEGILHQELDGHPLQRLFENLGYTLGFVLVILSRLQLFTENTITVILPLLNEPTRLKLWQTLRLWGVVLAANMAGTFVTAFITLYAGTTTPEYTEGMLEVSRQFAEKSSWEAFTHGIPAGFFIAAVVWMLPSARGFEIFVIILFTWLIATGEFTHVVAGATEVFMLLLQGELGAAGALGLLLPTFLGNVLGGTGLFALLAYAQVHEEM